MKVIHIYEYYCQDCKFRFTVKPHIAKTLKKYNKKAFCPRCDKDNTNKVGEAVQKKKTSIDDPPTEGQLSYIKSLGGNPNRAKTKGEAGAYINALKKINEKI